MKLKLILLTLLTCLIILFTTSFGQSLSQFEGATDAELILKWEINAAKKAALDESKCNTNHYM